MNPNAYPFPASTFESPFAFSVALFAVVLSTAVSVLLARKQIAQLWYDRSYGRDAVWVINTQVLAACIISILAFAPEVVYLISYAEASQETRENILAFKRACHIAAVIPALFWISNFLVWRTEILLRLRNARSRVWDDSRNQGFKRFVGLAAGSAGLAICVTLGRLFS